MPDKNKRPCIPNTFDNFCSKEDERDFGLFEHGLLAS